MTAAPSVPTGWAVPVSTTSTAKPAVTTAKPEDAPRTRISVRTASKNPVISVKTGEVSTPARAQEPVRVAAAGAGADAGNAPAAAPVDEQPRLEVPLDPEPDAAGPDAPVEPVVEVAPPETVITPAPANPAPVIEGAALTPEEAEGREVNSVRVVGNRVVDETTILLAANFKPGAAYVSRQAEIAVRNISALGFFNAVDQQVIPSIADPRKVDVTFVVIENRVVTGFRIEGNKEITTKDLLAVITSKPGSVLRSTIIDADVKKIQGLYSERGYAALVTDVRQEDDGTVVFAIKEGVVSKIELSGLNKTKPSIVRNQIATKPGDPFNERKIQKDLNRIYDTGFFEDVTYKVADDPDVPGALIVTLSLKEKRTGQFSVGAGFDSRSKISGFVGVSDTNFRGTGKNVSAQVELGSQRSFDLGFGDRYVGSNNGSYNINVYSRQSFRDPKTVEKVIGGTGGDDETFNYQEKRQGVRLNYTLPLDFERSKSFLFGYRNEKVDLLLENDENGVPATLPVNSSGRISAFSIGFIRDKRDLRLDPSSGSRELFVIEQAASLLGGTASFTKADLDVRRYYSLMGPQKRGDLPRLVLAGRFVAGRTFGQLPAFEQYFIGGSDTVRGNDDSEQFGDNQMYGNLELRFRFQRKLQFVAFADAGSAFGGEFSSSESPEVLFGVGVGVRLQTPIGPVRLDIANGRSGIKTHFGIGSSF